MDTSLTPTANDGINNPLNIRANKANAWLGKITPAGNNFEQFSAMWYGYRAGMKNLLNVAKQTPTHSFNDTIPVLSPASDNNNVPAYIQAIENAGVDTSVDVSTLDESSFKALIKAMAYHEQKAGFTVNEADIDAAYDDVFNNQN